MTYVKTNFVTLKMRVVNLPRDVKDLSRDHQRLEVRGKLGSKTLYYCLRTVGPKMFDQFSDNHRAIQVDAAGLKHLSKKSDCRVTSKKDSSILLKYDLW